MENAEHLHLSENSDVIFTSLHSVITGIVEQAAEEGILNTDIDGATDAIFTVLRGLHDHAATATPEQYEATHHAVRMLIQGSLFSFPRHSSGHSTRPGQARLRQGRSEHEVVVRVPQWRPDELPTAGHEHEGFRAVEAVQFAQG